MVVHPKQIEPLELSFAGAMLTVTYAGSSGPGRYGYEVVKVVRRPR
jgi:hypothetical protein